MNFIITHKQFDLPIDKTKYTVLCPKGTTIEGWPEIIYFESQYDNKLWSEIAAMDWIARNAKCDWVTINHYRRIGEYPPNLIGYAKPTYFNCNLAQQYQAYHNIDDLSLCSNIIKQIYPNEYPIWLQTIQSNVFYPYNMVSFPMPIYCDYMSKMMTVLTNVAKTINIYNKEGMMARIKTIKTYTEDNKLRNTNEEYQARLFAFLGERLSSWYINLLMLNNTVYPCEVFKYEGAW